jgi:hypothetical protein
MCLSESDLLGNPHAAGQPLRKWGGGVCSLRDAIITHADRLQTPRPSKGH